MTSSAHDPDDWQQQAAKHRAEQFGSNIQKLSKRGRRGNRMVGCGVMGFGLVALSLTVFRLLQPSEGEQDPLNLAWLGIGSVATITAGFAIWRGRDTRRKTPRE